MKRPRRHPGQRSKLNLADWGFTEIPLLGYYDNQVACHGLHPHRHSGAYEISLLIEGRQVYNYGGTHYLLSGGDLFLTRPGELHDTAGNVQEKGRLYWIQFSPPSRGQNALGLSSKESAVLSREFRKLKNRHVRARPFTQTAFDEAFQLCEQEITPRRRLQLGNVLTRLLLEMIDAFVNPSVPTLPEAVENAMRYLRNAPDRYVPLHELADACGYSVSWLKSSFRKATGMPPGEYAMRLRLGKACDLLNQGEGVTQVAHRLDFCSSQHFATIFRK